MTISFLKDVLIGCCRSGYDIAVKIIFKKRKPVVFAAPQHFNRDTDGKNPYFKRLIITCRQREVPYVLLESPEYNSPQPHDNDAVRIDLIFWLNMLLKKIILKINGHQDRKATKTVAKIINIFTFGKLNASTYITMAGLCIEMFQEMSPEATVYDLQHGIIYAGHSGYFDSDNNISASLAPTNCKILVWGNGYKNLFNDCKNGWDGKVITIGYPIKQTEKTIDTAGKHTILFSMQITISATKQERMAMKAMLADALQLIDPKRYIIKLKHHPRFNNEVDLSDIYEQYPYLIKTTDSLEKLASECLLNITWSSTTCFEFASYGIPTFLLSDSRYSLGSKIFYDGFKYPVFKDMPLYKVLEQLEKCDLICQIGETVKSWYSTLYAPWNSNVAQILFNNQTNE